MGEIDTYVCLLRGINVGGNNIISMAGLRDCFEKSGFTNVSTYINSGNVIFRSSETDTRKLADKIEKALKRTFSIESRVVVRSLEEMEKLISQIPKKWQSATNIRCYVVFLRPNIDNPKIMSELDPKPGIEEVQYCPGAVFWSTDLSGLTKSNVRKLITSPLYKDMTIRNQNTTRKVYEIMKIASKA